MAHDLARLKQLIRQGDVAFVNWKRIERTLIKLNWINDPDQGEARVHQVIMGLVHEECFQKVARSCKCEHNVPVGQDRFDANQYEIHWDVEKGVRRDTPCDGTLSFSIKLTEVVDGDGPYCGIVTFHLSPDL